MTAPIPMILPLSHAGRMHLLAACEMSVLLGRPIGADSWREAWGRAVDYEQVVSARTELARAERGAAA